MTDGRTMTGSSGGDGVAEYGGDYWAVICVTHNSATLLDEFVKSFSSRTGPCAVELHFVDSGSSDATVHKAARLAPEAVVHVLDGNRGFAAGINAALRVLSQRRQPPAGVIVVNPDVRFRPGTVDLLVAEMVGRPEAGVLAPRLVAPDGELQLSLRRPPTASSTWAEAIFGGPLAHRLGMPTEVVRERDAYETAGDVGWATGGFLAISWKCLETVGLWDESYFLYEEEVDFCLRAIDSGFAVGYVPGAVGVRLLDAGRTAPWIQALMRTNRVRHVHRRAGRRPAQVVRAGLVVGDLARAVRGRPEARAGLWALTRGADVDCVLRRYRPHSGAVLTSAGEDGASHDAHTSSMDRADDLVRVVRAFVNGAEAADIHVDRALLEAARRNQVLGVLCHVVDCGPDGEDVRRAHTAQSLQREHAIGVVARTLGSAGIDWLLLKGAVLSEVVYRTAGVRESTDVDVLVRPQDFERAVDELTAVGARLLDANWPLVRAQMRGELGLLMPGGVLVDLHWHVINDPAVRAGVSIHTGTLVDRSRTVRIGSQDIRTLDALDTAVYSAVHAWKSGGDRLRWLLDVQQAVARAGSERAIRARARSMGVEVPTLLMMRRAERVLAGMPDRSSDIDPGSRLWLRADRPFAPTSRRMVGKLGGEFSGRIVLRAARDGKSGIRAAVGAVRDAVRYRTGRGSGPTQDELRTPVDFPSDREAYFTAVASGLRDPTPGGPHVLVIVENLSVPFDRRVWQQSTALVRNGYTVTVVSPMGASQDTEPDESIDGVRILRYPLHPASGGPSSYIREYGVALWHSARLARKAHRERRVDVVHACNPPDLLLLVGLPFKLFGRAVLLFDHHDLVPELFESRFGSRKGLFYRLAVLLERATFAVADGVISTNESYRAVALQRGGKAPDRVQVVRSAPDLTRFKREPPDPGLRRGRRYLVAYLGVMGPQDGVDYALRALRQLRDDPIGSDLHVIMMGAGDSLLDMVRLRDELGLQDMVDFTGRVSDHFVRTCLSTADVCLAPDPMNPLNDVSTMNKIVEYMAMSRPLVSFDLKEARVSAGEAGAYATANDVGEFARLLAELLADEPRRRRMGEIGRQRVEADLSWDRSEGNLVAFYTALAPRA